MKRAHIIILIAVLVAIILIVAIINMGGSKENTSNATNIPNKQAGTQQNINIPEKDEYETLGLKPYEEFISISDEDEVILKQIQGKIDGISISGSTPLFLVGNKVYEDGLKFEEILNLEKNNMNFYDYHKNSNTRLYFTDEFKAVQGYDISFNKQELLFQGLSSENLRHISSYGNSLNAIKVKDNQVYVEEYQVIDNKQMQLLNSSQVRVKFKYQAATDDIINIYSEDSGNGLFVILSNNEMYSSDDGGIFYNNEGIIKEDNKCVIKCLESTKVSNVDKVFAESTKFVSPIHSKIGDENNLYTYERGVKLSDPHIEHKFSLPTGYKTSDIKNIIVDYSEMIIEFNDKNIYYANNMGEETYSITIEENISKLNKENKIVDMDFSSDYILLLMNNKKVYYK